MFKSNQFRKRKAKVLLDVITSGLSSRAQINIKKNRLYRSILWRRYRRYS